MLPPTIRVYLACTCEHAGCVHVCALPDICGSRSRFLRMSLPHTIAWRVVAPPMQTDGGLTQSAVRLAPRQRRKHRIRVHNPTHATSRGSNVGFDRHCVRSAHQFCVRVGVTRGEMKSFVCTPSGPHTSTSPHPLLTLSPAVSSRVKTGVVANTMLDGTVLVRND